jgi:hypothetical protein
MPDPDLCGSRRPDLSIEYSGFLDARRHWRLANSQLLIAEKDTTWTCVCTLCSKLLSARQFGPCMESVRRIGVSLGLAVDGQIHNAHIVGTH